MQWYKGTQIERDDVAKKFIDDLETAANAKGYKFGRLIEELRNAIS